MWTKIIKTTSPYPLHLNFDVVLFCKKQAHFDISIYLLPEGR